MTRCPGCGGQIMSGQKVRLAGRHFYHGNCAPDIAPDPAVVERLETALLEEAYDMARAELRPYTHCGHCRKRYSLLERLFLSAAGESGVPPSCWRCTSPARAYLTTAVVLAMMFIAAFSFPWLLVVLAIVWGMNWFYLRQQD
jgi:hypothetical protein